MRRTLLTRTTLAIALVGSFFWSTSAHAQQGCDTAYDVNLFIKSMNKADVAMAEFDLDMFRNTLELAHAMLPCTKDQIHPNHIVRFARMNAIAAFFDQDPMTMEGWAFLSQSGGTAPWSDDMGEDHPFRSTVADEFSEFSKSGPPGAFLNVPPGGGVLINGFLVLTPEAIEEAPNFVQVMDKNGMVLDSYWMDGTGFDAKILRGDDGGVAAPTWYSVPDKTVDPRAPVVIDQNVLDERDRLDKEKQSQDKAREAELIKLQAEAAKSAEKDIKRAKNQAIKEEKKAQALARKNERKGIIALSDGAPPPPPETWVNIDVDQQEDSNELESWESEGDDMDCANLIGLEPKALLGALSEQEVTCLERGMRHTNRQVQRDKISRVLVADAYAKGKEHRWEAAMRRHLNDIDRSDADLCYIFARYLAKQGPDRSNETIRWTELALTNKSNWQGKLRVDRVNALYRLRAIASQQRWYQAEQHYMEDTSRIKLDVAKKWRSRTKTMAREWLDYTRLTEFGGNIMMDKAQLQRNQELAFQICFSAAGTQEFCETPEDQGVASAE
ncbi:MAG: hypothetical protein ACI9MC_000876 [Kiritimatiellia bacterium]|jgi:hypothetical protein